MRTTTAATVTLVLASASLFASSSLNAPVTAPRATVAPGTRACELRLASLERDVARHPDDAVLHNAYGVCLQQLGQPTLARSEYKRAVGLRANYAEAHNNLGALEHADGSYKQAAKHYRKALRLKPELTAGHMNLGSALLAMKKTDEAIASYREAARLDPTILQRGGQVSGATGVDAATQLYLFAKVAAGAERVDDALLLLSRAQGLGFDDFDSVRRDPDFRSVVQDDRFAGLVR